MRKYLKKLREKNNLTQIELASKLEISQNYYSQIENGLRQESIKLELLTKLSKILNVNLDVLIKEEIKNSEKCTLKINEEGGEFKNESNNANSESGNSR